MRAYMETYYEIKAVEDHETEKNIERQNRKSRGKR